MSNAAITANHPDWVMGKRDCDGPSQSNSHCRGGIQPYPRSMPNSHYYTRLCVTSKGLRIITGRKASDAALERTAFLFDKVTAEVDRRVTDKMTQMNFRHAVMATYPTELTLDLPEYRKMPPSWNEIYRGMGATPDNLLGLSTEEDAMCHSNDRYKNQDITIHELAHSLHLVGLNQVYPHFDRQLKSLYNAARKSGNYSADYYAMKNYIEYFAEGVQSYFNANKPDRTAPTDRYQLYMQDRNLYTFIRRYIGSNPWDRTCP